MTKKILAILAIAATMLIIPYLFIKTKPTPAVQQPKQDSITLRIQALEQENQLLMDSILADIDTISIYLAQKEK